MGAPVELSIAGMGALLLDPRSGGTGGPFLVPDAEDVEGAEVTDDVDEVRRCLELVLLPCR